MTDISRRIVIAGRSRADAVAERLRGEGFAPEFADLARPGDHADARMIVLAWDRALLEDRSAARDLGFTLESGTALFNLMPDDRDLPPLPLAFADFRSGVLDDLIEVLKAPTDVAQRNAAVASPRPATRWRTSRQAGTVLSVALSAALAVVIWQGARDVSAPSTTAAPVEMEPAPPPPPPPPPPPAPDPSAPPDEAGEPAPGAPPVPMPARPPVPVTAPAPDVEPTVEPAQSPTPERVQPDAAGQSSIPVWAIALGAALAGGLVAFGLIALTRRGSRREPSLWPQASIAGAPALAPNFISYNMVDRPKVSAFVSEVEKGGTRCWMFDRDQAAASQWAAEIVRALRQSDRVIVFLTPKSCASPHVCRELTLADRFRKPIVPVMLEPCEPPDDVVYFLASLHELRVFEVGEEAARRLLREQVTVH